MKSEDQSIGEDKNKGKSGGSKGAPDLFEDWGSDYADKNKEAVYEFI